LSLLASSLWVKLPLFENSIRTLNSASVRIVLIFRIGYRPLMNSGSPKRKRSTSEQGKSISQRLTCQGFYSFGIGHSIQGKNRPWKKRYAKPFSPKDKDEASRIVREIFISSGLPPVEYILKILKKRGGSP
jgi:hypothetical protein